MKNIVLKELTLQDWKAQNRHVVFGEHINSISGRNQSGKTTLMKAFYWLICGRTDSQTVANQDLYDNTKEITAETPKASVTAIISIDGEDYKLQRVAEASFQRKRGTSEMVKSASDNYFYFVDDIARSKTDWQSWIEEHIASEDMLQFILDGSFFIGKIFDDKKQARQIIEKTVGSVTREEMKGDYSVIEELLKKYSLDEIDTRAQNMAKGIEQRLNEIPSLIHSKQNEISEIEQIDFTAIDKEISSLESEREELDKRMTDLSERLKPQMEAKHNAEMEQQMKKDVFDKAYSDWHKSFTARMEKIADEVNAVRKQNEKSEKARQEEEAERKILMDMIERDKKSLELAKQKREYLLKQRDEEKNKVLDAASTYCPHCGQLLQEDKLKLVAENFERVKRERIEAIVSEGKLTASNISALTNRIEEAQRMLSAPLPQVITQSTKELEQQYAELANVDKSRIAFMETEQGKALLDDIGSVVIPEVTMPDDSEIVEAKKRVNEQLVPLYERRGLKNRLQTLLSAVDELRAEQKEKGADLAVYECQRRAVKDFKQEQMEILSHKVNDGLKFSRLEVWSKQKDGTTIPDLVLKDAQGVNFATTNGASRIVTTCDIQRFFCDKLGVNMPCFIDESSILNQENIPHYDGVQTFLLYCADTSLKIESE